MRVGIPKEIKANENRVALIPAGVEILSSYGHEIIIEKAAGLGSGFTDEDYVSSGAEIGSGPTEVFKKADMIMKVKEPLPEEYGLIRENQIVFTYFHFAASLELTEAVVDSKCIAIAYETVQNEEGQLPLLIPMSEVAGRMAIQEGARYLEKLEGGYRCVLVQAGGRGPISGGFA